MKFVLAADEVAEKPRDPTAARIKLLKQDPKSFRLTLKSHRPQDESTGFIWLETLYSSPPPQDGSQTTTYLNEAQVLRLVDALAREGYLRRGHGGEAKLGDDVRWVSRIANSKFAQFQVIADDESGEATRQALLKLIAEAAGGRRAGQTCRESVDHVHSPCEALAPDDTLRFNVVYQNLSKTNTLLVQNLTRARGDHFKFENLENAATWRFAPTNIGVEATPEPDMVYRLKPGSKHVDVMQLTLVEHDRLLGFAKEGKGELQPLEHLPPGRYRFTYRPEFAIAKAGLLFDVTTKQQDQKETRSTVEGLVEAKVEFAISGRRGGWSGKGRPGGRPQADEIGLRASRAAGV